MSCAGLLSMAALWVAAEPTMTLQSDTACPSAEAVGDALVELGVGERGQAASAKVRATTSGLVIELGWPEGRQSQYRTLTVEEDCTARARAAAIVVAAWLGSLPTTTLSAPAAQPASAPIIAKPAAGETPPKARRWLLGLGFGVGASGDFDVAPSLAIEATRRLSGRLGLAIAAGAAGPRQRTVGPGTSHFVRSSMALMGRIFMPAGAVRADFDVGVAGGLTVAWGSDYPNNDSQHAFDFGPVGGIRVVVGSGHLRPWLGARFMYWVRSQRLHYEDLPTGNASETTVSHFEGSLALGCDVELL
jgi:hypothetical protein